MPRRSSLLRAWLLSAAASCCLQVSAQLLQPEPPSEIAVQELWPSVAFDISVTSQKANPAPLIDAAQLDVHVDGKAMPSVQLVLAGTEPQSVCLLIDTSGSTYADFNAIRRSAEKLIAALPAADQLCLVDFSVQAYVDAELTFDRAQLRKGLSYIRPSGGSAVDDALIGTIAYLNHNARFRSRVIILLSDGGDNASKAHDQAVDQALAVPGAPVVYTIDNQDAAPHDTDARGERDYRKRLLRFAEVSGGLPYFARGNDQVDRSVQDLVQTLSRRYRLTLTMTGPANGAAHRLDVHLNKDLSKQKLDVNAPRGFNAPAH